jgi:hypothetical protein
MTPATSEFVFGIPMLLVGTWTGGIGFGLIRPPVSRRWGAQVERQYLLGSGPRLRRAGLTLTIGGIFLVLHAIWRLVNPVG